MGFNSFSNIQFIKISFSRKLRTVLKTPTTLGITVTLMFNRFFSSRARSRSFFRKTSFDEKWWFDFLAISQHDSPQSLYDIIWPFQKHEDCSKDPNYTLISLLPSCSTDFSALRQGSGLCLSFLRKTSFDEEWWFNFFAISQHGSPQSLYGIIWPF